MGGVDRRQILQGAAWAAPVVAVSTAVPAASASSPVYLGHLSASDSGSVKEIGGSTVYLRLNVAVSSDTRVPVNSVLTAAVSLLIDNPLRASDYEVNAVPTGWTQASSGTLATHTFTRPVTRGAFVSTALAVPGPTGSGYFLKWAGRARPTIARVVFSLPGFQDSAAVNISAWDVPYG